VKLVFLGPPGSGKGTQATRLSTALGVAHISTGDMLRGAIAAGTPMGKEVEGILARGELVSDDVIAALVEERVQAEDCANGFLLDGFPRTLPQAELLDGALERLGLALDVVILIDVPEDELMRRLTSRGQGRDDDKPEVIRHRLGVYRDQTAPLADLYRGRGLLRELDGVGTVDDVATRVVAAAETGQ
jgi:adenylate kinase